MKAGVAKKTTSNYYQFTNSNDLDTESCEENNNTEFIENRTSPIKSIENNRPIVTNKLLGNKRANPTISNNTIKKVNNSLTTKSKFIKKEIVKKIEVKDPIKNKFGIKGKKSALSSNTKSSSFDYRKDVEGIVDSIKFDENELENSKYMLNIDFFKNFQPDYTIENTNKDLLNDKNSLKISRNKNNLMDVINRLSETNVKNLFSDQNHKVCRLNDTHIRLLINQAYKTNLTSDKIKVLKYKIYKRNTLTKVGSQIQEHFEDIYNFEPKELVVCIMFEFTDTSSSFNFFKENIGVNEFDVAIFYKLGTKLVVGGRMNNSDGINSFLSNKLWNSWKIMAIKIEYYQELADMFCDIHHYSKLESKISLNYKLNNTTEPDANLIINQGYQLNRQRYCYKLLRQLKLKYDIDN